MQMGVKLYKFPKELLNNIESISHLFGSAQNLIPKYLLTYLYGTGVHLKNYSDFFKSDLVLKKLFKEAELIETNETKTLDRNEKINGFFQGDEFVDSDKTYTFFYKDNIVRININEEVSLNSNKKENCTIAFFTPNNKECADKEFFEFISTNEDPKVFLLNQEYGDYNFTKFSVSLPKTFDLELNYGEGFNKINKKLIDSLNKNHSGLYMFHGPPGTGKSTYIKYLSSVIKKDVIFFPTGLIGNITSPEIVNLLLRKQNCILILEDAEKAIVKRDSSSDSSLVSSLLNMTDGILGDVLKINVIVTYNCDRAEIDEALLRRGRLKAEHSFKPLAKDYVKKLVEKLNLDVDVKEDMTLADIYNYKKDEELIGNRDSILNKPRIGFI